MNDTQIGDIVILKTGGPRMTVCKIKNDTCTCMFFVNDILNKIKVPINSLENVTGIEYTKEDIIQEEPTSFIETIKSRDDLDATNLVDDSTMEVLTKYIKEDQSQVLEKVNSRCSSVNMTQEEFNSIVSNLPSEE